MPCKNKISTDSNFHYKKFNFLPATIPICEKVGLVFFLDNFSNRLFNYLRRKSWDKRGEWDSTTIANSGSFAKCLYLKELIIVKISWGVT
jgi:hypothetical protein